MGSLNSGFKKLPSTSPYVNILLFQFANDCRCSSTLEPTIPKDDLSGESDAIANEDLDVVFLGDTLIENCARGLDSVSSNEDRTMERNGMAAVCHRLFRKDNGGLINGIALGASDDRVSYLSFGALRNRILKFQPKGTHFFACRPATSCIDFKMIKRFSKHWNQRSGGFKLGQMMLRRIIVPLNPSLGPSCL